MSIDGNKSWEKIPFRPSNTDVNVENNNNNNFD
jgi:hypothetical protein